MKEDLLTPNNSLELFGINDDLNYYINLYELEKLPRVNLLSGKKGVGKFTLINHLMNYIFDKENYNYKYIMINDNSCFNNSLKLKIFSNIIYINPAIDNVKIEQIRNLKQDLMKTSMNNLPRFIIIDDVETLNNNCLNTLLRIIEEPLSNNHFFLIDNKTNPLLETVKSRCIEKKIFLKNELRIKIIENIIQKYQVTQIIDYENNNITPGSFVLFTHLCEVNNINPRIDVYENFKTLYKLFKKNKNLQYIALFNFFLDNYYYDLYKNKIIDIEILSEIKNNIDKNIKNLIQFNLNPSTLINSLFNLTNYAR